MSKRVRIRMRACYSLTAFFPEKVATSHTLLSNKAAAVPEGIQIPKFKFTNDQTAECALFLVNVTVILPWHEGKALPGLQISEDRIVSFRSDEREEKVLHFLIGMGNFCHSYERILLTRAGIAAKS